MGSIANGYLAGHSLLYYGNCSDISFDHLWAAVNSEVFCVLKLFRNLSHRILAILEFNAVHSRQLLRQHCNASSLNVMLQAFPSVTVVFPSKGRIFFRSLWSYPTEVGTETYGCAGSYYICAEFLFVSNSPLVRNQYLIPFRICQLWYLTFVTAVLPFWDRTPWKVNCWLKKRNS